MKMTGPVLFDRVKQKCIEFNDVTEFSIGRSITCNINIPETCISRCQCIIQKMPEGEWLVQDKSSFKSTFLNGNKIPQCGQYLKSLDLITFSNSESCQLVFYESKDDVPPSAKRRRLNDENLQAASQESATSIAKPVEAANNKYKLKCQTLSEELQTVLTEKKALEAELKDVKEEKDQVDDILIGSHLDSKQLLEDFESSRIEIERLAQERDELLESCMKKDASEAAAQPLATQSQPSTSELESNLIMKSIEVEELKDELQDTKLKLEKANELVQCLSSQNEKVYNDAVAVLEQEFLCCVCSDLLYEPVTLNCRHTICRDCLKEWKKKKKECPSCRTKIKSEVSPLMVDAFIDRIAPLLGEEFLSKREESKRERTAPKTPPPRPAPPPIPPPVQAGGSSRGNTGGRGRGRARRGRNDNRAPYPIPQPHVIPGVIDLTDRSPAHPNAGQANREPINAEEADSTSESEISSGEADSYEDSPFEGFPRSLNYYDSFDDYDYSDDFIDDEEMEIDDGEDMEVDDDDDDEEDEVDDEE